MQSTSWATEACALRAAGRSLTITDIIACLLGPAWGDPNG
jgi:hypothetical protein